MKIWSILLALFMTLASLNVEAARFGGGRSFGKQSGNVTQRQATPAKPAQQAGNNAAAAAPKKPWGAMLGGLAAGLGLAWLAHSLGLGEGFGQILLLALLAFAGIAAYRWFKRSRETGGSGAGSGPYAYQGAQAGSGNQPASAQLPSNAAYRSNNSPTSTGGMGALGAGAAGGSMIGSALRGQQSTWDIPPGFDSQAFVTAAKGNFVTMQSAWDRSDLSALRAMMTDDMLAEIRTQLAERDSHTGVRANKTEVVTLEAELLGIEDLGNDYMASVEFNGMIQEDDANGPHPFREVWNMTKPKNGASGWLVAGVQALQ